VEVQLQYYMEVRGELHAAAVLPMAETAFGTHWIGWLIGLRSRSGNYREEMSFPQRKSNPGRQARCPSLRNDCATPVLLRQDRYWKRSPVFLVCWLNSLLFDGWTILYCVMQAAVRSHFFVAVTFRDRTRLLCFLCTPCKVCPKQSNPTDFNLEKPQCTFSASGNLVVSSDTLKGRAMRLYKNAFLL
jgi:hypothetical protein